MSKTSEGSTSIIETMVNNYLTKEVVTNPDLLPLKNDTQLIRSGILDSLSLLKLVFFLEQQFQITVGMEDVVPANFDTIDTIVALVRSKKAA
jgi:methoxymalonate biosynthesis acyl carrier protein